MGQAQAAAGDTGPWDGRLSSAGSVKGRLRLSCPSRAKGHGTQSMAAHYRGYFTVFLLNSYIKQPRLHNCNSWNWVSKWDWWHVDQQETH